MIGYNLPGLGLTKGAWSEPAFALYGWNTGALTIPIDAVVYLKTPTFVVEVTGMTTPVTSIAFADTGTPIQIIMTTIDSEVSP